MRMPWQKKPDQAVDFEAVVASAISAAVQKLQPNASPSEESELRARMGRFLSGTYDNADSLHNIYQDFGYPLNLTFTNFWNMYRRFGVAKNVVELPVETSWMTLPKIEGSEQLARDIAILDDMLDLWTRVKGLDTRQRVGRYAGMFMRVRDGKTPDQPITNKFAGLGALVQMVPLYEGQLTVLEIHNDPAQANYGLPKMYMFNGGATGNVNEKTATTFNIHPDRIVIAAEGADNGDIYGTPALEACYNSLMDLRKVIGSGGEGFYRNAAQSIVFKLQDASQAQQNASLLASFNEQYDDFSRNRARRAIWTPGLDPQALQSTLIAGDSFFNSPLNDVAAASKIPATILIGQQTGRLASSEDSRSFLSTINSRRENFVSQMIADVIDWMMLRGILATAKYTIEWDDLLALSDQEKLDNADKMAGVNHKQFQSGGQPVFSAEEIRESAGFEVEDMPDIDESLPEEPVEGGES